jgi:hypothetical protein
MLLLPEGQMGEAGEASKKQCSCRSRGTLDTQLISLFFFFKGLEQHNASHHPFHIVKTIGREYQENINSKMLVNSIFPYLQSNTMHNLPSSGLSCGNS